MERCFFMWGAYFCIGAYKCNVVVVIKMSAYIPGVLCVGAYYPVCIPKHDVLKWCAQLSGGVCVYTCA